MSMDNCEDTQERFAWSSLNEALGESRIFVIQSPHRNVNKLVISAETAPFCLRFVGVHMRILSADTMHIRREASIYVK